MSVRVYIDTSVVVALSNHEDGFHTASVRFLRNLRGGAFQSLIGPAFLLEVAKSTERRGAMAASKLVGSVEEYGIEVATSLGHELWDLSDEYSAFGVLAPKRTLDLLHYASATLLGCTHIASWDGIHFNGRVEKRVNKVNESKGLASLRVGDPITVARYLEIA